MAFLMHAVSWLYLQPGLSQTIGVVKFNNNVGVFVAILHALWHS